jgi:hypothetical protein
VGYKLWSPLDLLASSDVNAYLMKQTVIVCTSGTRPASPPTGMVITETDTGKMQRWNGSSWRPVASIRNSFTPTLSSTGTSPTLGTGSAAQGWYTYLSEAVIYTFKITFGTSGNTFGSGSYQVNVPVSSALPFGASHHSSVGTIQLADASTGALTAGSCFVDASSSGTLLGLISSAGIVTTAVPWTWANSDYISGSIIYPV